MYLSVPALAPLKPANNGTHGFLLGFSVWNDIYTHPSLLDARSEMHSSGVSRHSCHAALFGCGKARGIQWLFIA